MKASNSIPIHQKAITRIEWILLGVAALGNTLDWIGNAVSIITFKVSLLATIIIGILWAMVVLYANFKGIDWVFHDGEKRKIKGLNGKFHLPVLGIILLLWIPRLLEKPKEIKIHPIIFTLGESDMQNNMTEEIVYSIPFNLDSIKYVTTYLPIFVSNIETEKTIEDITLAIHYPPESNIGMSMKMIKNTLGEIESDEFRRRTELFNNIHSTYFHVKDIKSQSSIYLAEPIQLPIEIIKSNSLVGKLTISITGKNMSPLNYNVVIFSKWEKDNSGFNKAINEYYINDEKPDFTLALSDFMPATDSIRNKSFIASDPLKIKFKTLKVK
ncbi:MAG: hypothetical protein H7246_21900 [Phycisphaerae bacterium]|nr:hypothetical protein [Saprospiraceae bacterium]